MGTPVTLTKCNADDTARWLTGAAIQRMKELGASDRLEHQFGWWLGPSNEDPLSQVLKIACKCGWTFSKIVAAHLTTASSVVSDLLTEHALFRTDPNHYTYYPAHAEGRTA